MPLSYTTANLARGAADTGLVRALQCDLRALGYLKQGMDGVFQGATDAAVRRLQHDLMTNDGHSTRDDGDAPVAIRDYNQGRVAQETGVVDPGLAACIEALLIDSRVPKLPSSADAPADNRAARAAVAAAQSLRSPAPFLLAIFGQESADRHYCEPSGGDTDSFVVLGLDYLPGQEIRVTSRGYGIGQYTIFHHPPRPEEVQDFVIDPVRNVQKADGELRAKFDGFVLGGTPDTTADDRVAEHPLLKELRPCRYQSGDARYLRDCRACAMQVRKVDLAPDTPAYHGATETYAPAPHYAPTTYHGVPDRAEFLCDWPYAVRRYNGSGPDSYNYQARVLLNLLNVPSPAAET